MSVPLAEAGCGRRGLPRGTESNAGSGKTMQEPGATVGRVDGAAAQSPLRSRAAPDFLRRAAIENPSSARCTRATIGERIGNLELAARVAAVTVGTAVALSSHCSVEARRRPSPHTGGSQTTAEVERVTASCVGDDEVVSTCIDSVHHGLRLVARDARAELHRSRMRNAC